MTMLPKQTARKIGLVIDLNSCVGCHACAVSCKEWNTSGHSAPLTDYNPQGDAPDGVWLNRVHSYEVTEPDGNSLTLHFPKSCLHCDDAPCVTVCPTGASYKREEDGIVLVNADTCIGCKLCSWACPYGAREYDEKEGVMKKCTMCVDRIYNPNLPESSRVPACVAACPTGARHFGDLSDEQSDIANLVKQNHGYALMPEQDCKPVNQYLPPQKRSVATKSVSEAGQQKSTSVDNAETLLQHWQQQLDLT